MTIDPELARQRAAMDAINQRLVQALHERARLCRAIGVWKRARGIAPIDPPREERMLAALLHDVPADGLPREELAAILAAVFAASRRLVQGSQG